LEIGGFVKEEKAVIEDHCCCNCSYRTVSTASLASGGKGDGEQVQL
jgi:hypothetical protein